MTTTINPTDLATQVVEAVEVISKLSPRNSREKELLKRIEAALSTDGSRWKSLLRTDAAFKMTRANAPDWLKNSLRDTEANLQAHVTAVGELEARLTALEHRVADHSVTLGLHGADIAQLKARMGRGWKSQLWVIGALCGIGLAHWWMWAFRFHGSQANRWGWAALVGVFGLFIGLAVSCFMNRLSASGKVFGYEDDVAENEEEDDDDSGNTVVVTPPAMVAVGTGAADPAVVPNATAPAVIPAASALPATTVIPTTVVTPAPVTTTP